MGIYTPNIINIYNMCIYTPVNYRCIQVNRCVSAIQCVVQKNPHILSYNFAMLHLLIPFTREKLQGLEGSKVCYCGYMHKMARSRLAAGKILPRLERVK